MTNEDLYSYVPDPLWERFKKGDQEAFAQLYNEHIDNLLLYGMKTIRKEQVVKDAIQDLFVELWRSRENLQSVRSVPLYLFKSLRYKLFRENKMRMEVPSASIPAYPSLLDSSIEMLILQREEECSHREKISHAIRQLPCRQQEAINLRFYQGFSNEQIALIMDINYQSVINLIHKAILQLRKHLGYILTLLIWVISIV
ncbi:MAG: RNA polymerase sigma factor [Chitinophagaceae bacterium]|nr:RNA polymerase sigma factor [Chitinophagaceae bacterium]